MAAACGSVGRAGRYGCVDCRHQRGARRRRGAPVNAPAIRDRALRRDPAQPLRQRAQRAAGGRVQHVHRPRRQPADEAQPPRQRAHRVVRGRARPAPVALGQELGLVGGHVHADRAVALAALARQAQVQRLGDLVGPPAVRDHLAVRHLEQQPRAAAGGVLLLAGRPVARAHHAAPAARDALARRPGSGARRAAKSPPSCGYERDVRRSRAARHPDEHAQVVVEASRAGPRARG